MSLQKGDWATSLDLRDAYFHIPIHRKSRRYLRFFFKGKIYQFRALPFGLSVSPYVFSRVLKVVLRHVRRLGFLSARLPGRLATTVYFRSPVLATQQKTSEHYTGTRICSQLGEIRTGSNTEILFSRSPVQLDQRSDGSFFGENINFSTGVNSTVECQTSFSLSATFHCRTDGINGESSSLGEVTQEVSPVGNQREMVPGRLSLGTTNQVTSLVPQGCATMARQGVFNVLVSNPSSPSRLSVVHRLKSG